jgi:GNAT superfamily N-acetyltransferase
MLSEKIEFRISPEMSVEELNDLFRETWPNHVDRDFSHLSKSLEFVCAYSDDRLVGFVNVAWDGAAHAFLLDTTVHPEFQKQGIGLALVSQAKVICKTNEIEWLHVDYEPDLEPFYKSANFVSTKAGLIRISVES